MPHQCAFQVGVGVVLAGLVVSIVETGRRQLLEPDLEIVNQSVLPVVDVYGGRDVHRRHEHHAFGDTAPVHNRRHFVGDADELLALLRVEPQVVGKHLHWSSVRPVSRTGPVSGNDASAFTAKSPRTPARKLRSPAAPIIAALSVENPSPGMKTGSSRASPRRSASCRSRLFADTPPAMPTLRARC